MDPIIHKYLNDFRPHRLSTILLFDIEANMHNKYPERYVNMVVDAVVRHWVSVMAEGAEERGGHIQEGRHQNTIFYADGGMVASSDLRWLQGYFNTLAGLFERVGLRNNFRKTVGMV